MPVDHTSRIYNKHKHYASILCEHMSDLYFFVKKYSGHFSLHRFWCRYIGCSEMANSISVKNVQGRLVLRDCLELQALQAKQAPLALQGLQATPGLQELQATRARQATVARRAVRDSLGRLGRQVLVETLVQRGQQGLQVARGLVAHLELQAGQVLQAHWGLPERLGHKDLLELVEERDQQGFQAQQVIMSPAVFHKHPKTYLLNSLS